MTINETMGNVFFYDNIKTTAELTSSEYGIIIKTRKGACIYEQTTIKFRD